MDVLDKLAVKNASTNYLPITVSIPISMNIDSDFKRDEFFKKDAETNEPTKPNFKIKTKIKPILKKRTTTKPIPIGVITGPLSDAILGDDTLANRIKKPSIQLKASPYYMANRQVFVNFINALFDKYKKEEAVQTCDRDENIPFSPMVHQQIVRDYVSLYSPYRGLLLYHGLGSGKTCSSIAIAEGLKTAKQIVVMTPASLRTNYYEELKKCGDLMYRKNQHWDFIADADKVELLSHVLSISVEFIKKQGGAWLMDMSKPPNFEKLTSAQQKNLDKQITEMIHYKYSFINYNGMRKANLTSLSKNHTINPFDNKVVIIDEAHNFVSRIVNKLGKEDTLSGQLYEYLMSANNIKIVMLTGTPIINYPNEIAVLFNMIRGYIKTWKFDLTIESNDGTAINKAFFENLFNSKTNAGRLMDYIEYKSSRLTITRNPYGFVTKQKNKMHDGVIVGERGEVTDENYVKYIKTMLAKHKIKVNRESVDYFKALPDNLKDFQNLFIDQENRGQNMDMFKRRILGLPSYFRDIEELMPRYNKSEDFKLVELEMSDYQFGVYEEARVQERKLESQNAKKRKKDIYEDTVSTYRIFSRAFCNFVFPKEIERPLPGQSSDLEGVIMNNGADEDALDALTAAQKQNNIDGLYEADELQQKNDYDKGYAERVQSALNALDTEKLRYLQRSEDGSDGLQQYSPKFLAILENILDDEHRGLHLIYSQFRTIEGIGILKLVLEANGFAHFRVKRVGDAWQLDLHEADMGKPLFALYTGTETDDEKEIIRNVFNGTWKYVPSSLATQLQTIAPNNMLGEIIKVLMITASGAEGISLRNVRYVHITEPYWHPVRINQVIGRARRICSHNELPEELQTVNVFLYLMKFSEPQLSSDDAIELRLKDKSKLDSKRILTSDEALFEISTIKETVNRDILQAVKEAAIDCTIHSSEKDPLKCFTFGTNDPTLLSYQPSIDSEEQDVDADKNKEEIRWVAIKKVINGVEMAVKKPTKANQKVVEVYDLANYNIGNAVLKGHLHLNEETNQYEYKPVFE